MKKSILSSILVAGLLSSGLASAEEKKPTWAASMQGLYKSLATLLTDVTSDQRYNDPKNAARIL
jgi:hypothetical protein